MDPWQEIALDAILKERADGKWASREAAYLVGRQNGKGGILSALCLAAMFLFDDVHEILFSAHEFKTAKKAYRDIKALIESTSALLAQVERRGSRIVGFRQSNEDTSISLADGTVLRFMARSNNTARGFSPQLVIADEAQECTQDTRSALFYTIRAQANPLVVWCGTAPGPKQNGEVFRALRNRGRKGGDRSLAWLEWTPDPDCDPKSLEAIIQSTPGMPYRVTLDTVEAEREAALVDDEAWAAFCREALSIWPDDAEGDAWGVVTKEQWFAQRTSEVEPKSSEPGWLMGAVALGIEMPSDRSSVSVAAVGDCREGGHGIEVAAHGAGVGWLVPKIVDLTSNPDRPVSHVVVDPNSPAGALIPDLEAAGVIVTSIKYGDFVRSTGDMYDAIVEAEVVHRDRPDLNTAVASACRRIVGNSWLIDRRSGSPELLNAAIIARYGHMIPVAPPKKSYRVGGFR